MVEYRSEVTVARPPAAVFPYIIEREKQALWSDVEMRPLTEGPLGQGSRIEIAFGMGPLRATIQLEFARVEEDRLVRWSTISDGAIQWEGEYRLEPDGSDRTLLQQEGRLQFRGLWRLLAPIVGAEIREGEIKELQRLKAAVEAA